VELLATSLYSIIPEVFLAIAGMFALIVGVIKGHKITNSLGAMIALFFVVAFVFVMMGPSDVTKSFNGMFIVDSFAACMKVLILLASFLTLVMSLQYWRAEQRERFEYPVLILFATLGMMLMVSANDLMSLYMGLELQSLCLYVLAAFRRNALRSSEAGLKYFVLGALASGFLLYGCSLIYGYMGTTNFSALGEIFGQMSTDNVSMPLGVMVGLVFIIVALCFKISAVPFHMWTPDVYEGAPTCVAAFFAVAPKAAAIGLFLRLIQGPFGDSIEHWRQIIIFISVLSMVVGALGAIWQNNIKRLLAYSSIGHVGYMLIGFATGTQSGVHGVLIYLSIYIFMAAGTFACVLALRRQGQLVRELNDLQGLAKTHPMVALLLAIFMFSMAGIPPLAGFFGKLYIFLAAIQENLIALAVLGVLTSVIGAFYYIRVIKIMYFDINKSILDRVTSKSLSAVMIVTGIFTLFFFAYPAIVIESTRTAAVALIAF
jgi:NADH-quinone oxidoreductase subunit N